VTEEKPRAVYTPEMLAERWQCSANHVRNLLKRGELQYFRLGPRLIRIKLAAVEEYERRQSEIPTEAEAARNPYARAKRDDFLFGTTPRSPKEK
jgi:excisionase family DNA binding protein